MMWPTPTCSTTPRTVWPLPNVWRSSSGVTASIRGMARTDAACEAGSELHMPSPAVIAAVSAPFSCS